MKAVNDNSREVGLSRAEVIIIAIPYIAAALAIWASVVVRVLLGKEVPDYFRRDPVPLGQAYVYETR